MVGDPGLAPGRPLVLVVPGPGLEPGDALSWAVGADLEVILADASPSEAPALAAAAGLELLSVSEEEIGPSLVGAVVAPGTAGFASESLADVVARATVPVVAVDPGDLREAGIDPRSCPLARAGARVLHGRGPDTARYAFMHLRAWSSNPPLTLAYGDHPDHVGDLWRPGHWAGPWPVVVLLHGGFWRDPWERDLMDRLAADLTRFGFAAWNLEYRRVGAGGGWPATADDVAAGIDYLNALAGTHPLDLSRVLLVGHEAGGQLALWAASRTTPGALRPHHVAALASLCDLSSARQAGIGEGAVDLLLRSAPDAEAALSEASPIALVPLAMPVLLVHAPDDPVVPVEQSRAYVAAAVAAAEAAGSDRGTAFDRARLYDFRVGGHFDAIDPNSEIWSSVVCEMASRTQFFVTRALEPFDPLASRLDDLIVALTADHRFAGLWWDRLRSGAAQLSIAMVSPATDEADRLTATHRLPPDRFHVHHARHSLPRLLHYRDVVEEILTGLPAGPATFRLARVVPAELAVVIGTDQLDRDLITQVFVSVPCDAVKFMTGPEERVAGYLNATTFRHPAFDALPPDVDPNLSTRGWLRRRSFRLQRWYSPYETGVDADRHFVTVHVDGEPLWEVLQPFERYFGGIPYPIVAPPSRHWLGEPQEGWVGDRGIVVVDGSCGVWECCGVTAHIEFTDDEAYWAVDRSGTDWDRLWRWRRLAWLRFDRAEYEAAISSLDGMEAQPWPHTAEHDVET